MPPIQGMNGMMGREDGPNLFSILVNIAFGYAAGLIIFLGFKEVLTLGSGYATDILKATGYGQQMGGFGIASAAPYIVLAPLAGLVVKQLTSVRTIKGFLYFACAVALGVGIAFLTKGNVS